jgi:hypothetical protein
MDRHDKAILAQLIAAALSTGQRWEKACWEGTYAFLKMRQCIDYIENCPED